MQGGVYQLINNAKQRKRIRGIQRGDSSEHLTALLRLSSTIVYAARLTALGVLFTILVTRAVGGHTTQRKTATLSSGVAVRRESPPCPFICSNLRSTKNLLFIARLSAES